MEETKQDVIADATVTKISDTEVEVSKVIPEKVVTEVVSLNDLEARIKEKDEAIADKTRDKTKNEEQIAKLQAEIEQLQSDKDELVALKTKAEETGIIKE